MSKKIKCHKCKTNKAYPEDIKFDPDLKLVEETKPTAKVLPFKGKIGAISGDKDE